MANDTLKDFEEHIRCGPVAASRVIGVAYPTYAQYRSQRRPLPRYHKNHIEDLKRLDDEALQTVVESRATNG